MTGILSDDDSFTFLQDELRRRFSSASFHTVADNILLTDAPLASSAPLMFVRQGLPNAEFLEKPSINTWAASIVDRAIAELPEGLPWRLHLVPVYGDGKAGANRVRLILDAVKEQLQKKRRAVLRSLVVSEDPFDASTSLIQLILTAPDAGVLSVAAAPTLLACRHVVSPFPGGVLPVAEDKSAPSRAFSKLMEAQLRMGRTIASGESVVDLGASPGGWSYVAIQRGAQVTAIDRTELRADLMSNKRLQFVKGDAFRFQPETKVDWMVCDVIAAPERSIDNLLHWARSRWMRHFVVSIKFKGDAEYDKVDRLAALLPEHCSEFRLTRLNANKNEACAMGSARD